MYEVVFSKVATKDKQKLKAANLVDKTKALLCIIQENPFQNPLTYEKLLGNLKDKYSRRISIQHRLVHSVYPSQDNSFDGFVLVHRM